ncbi:hypothetical protein QU481_23065 [Crenobacter sp. SG2303]|uniref:Uncharacterized protein n=1 Tax=Crenobacter oryzisoli TaxID=3056844 RepID=A0ABT7XV86_9NEIS|nr:hypothetical protein [Crenobacter sp. SG2303]MDN0077696.1 hypothetical protein [Crenobacter sp. SG2303]
MMEETIQVPAREMWVKTSILVRNGEPLKFRAKGVWVDAVIPCSADGYSATILYSLGRPPRIPDGDRYFRLMGRVVPNGLEPTHDDPLSTFPIGVQNEWISPIEGVLFVFVNDRSGYYWNNWGAITLTVIREYSDNLNVPS